MNTQMDTCIYMDHCIGEPEGDDVIFAVERISGQVTAYGPLDRERESRYLFHVRVSELMRPLVVCA